MDNFGIRLYQSGKTRRRNANKKKNLQRYRKMLSEQQKQHVHLPDMKHSDEVPSVTAQHKQADFPLQPQLKDVDIMNEHTASIAVHVGSLLPVCVDH